VTDLEINLNNKIAAKDKRIDTLERMLMISVDSGVYSSKEMFEKYKSLVLRAVFDNG
jgi:hypothetical protein